LLNQPAAGVEPGAGPDAALRTMRIRWGVFVIAVGMFFLVTRMYRPDDETAAESGGGNPTILLVLAAAALTSVVASFVVKANFYRRAAEQQNPSVLQTGFLVAMALCEAAVLLGLVGVFLTWNDYAYLLFALGGLGEAAHFPRREQVLSAYFKPGV
jgi:F0F1-type ATP synthase membrane subunit c/vacuolar-type H+-ATPase subunit K